MHINDYHARKYPPSLFYWGVVSKVMGRSLSGPPLLNDQCSASALKYSLMNGYTSIESP